MNDQADVGEVEAFSGIKCLVVELGEEAGDVVGCRVVAKGEALAADVGETRREVDDVAGFDVNFRAERGGVVLDRLGDIQSA